jgi:hypothetical protein
MSTGRVVKSKTITLMVVCAVITGCAARQSHRFEVRECRTATFAEYGDDEDCEKGKPRRVKQEHCVVLDHQTGCIVGAFKERNPDYSPSSDFGTGKREYVYTRVYDWECPAGIAPPGKNEFWFTAFIGRPLDCDDELVADPLRQNPLLHLPQPPVKQQTGDVK